MRLTILQMKDRKYYIVNIIVLSITLYFFCQIISESIIKKALEIRTTSLMPLILLGIMIIYILKAIRLYFIMLEYKISLKDFIKVYLKTAFVSISIPFKVGEFFKIYCYGKEIKNYRISTLLVLMDRYFDTIPLTIILVVLSISGENKFSSLILYMLLFLMFVTILYWVFPSTYYYLNQYLIKNTYSDRGIRALFYLSQIKQLYITIKELVKSRFLILFILSSITWVLEYGILAALFTNIGKVFKGEEFVQYINAVFWGNHNEYINLYISLGAIVLFVIAILVYGIYYRRKR